MQLTNRNDHAQNGHRQVLTQNEVLTTSWGERRNEELHGVGVMG